MKLERNAHSSRRPALGPWAMAAVLATMWAVLAVLPATGGRFLTQGNLASLLSQSAVLLVVAVGMTFAILIRGIDLSVGAGVALTGVVAGLVHVKCGLPAPVAILAALVLSHATSITMGEDFDRLNRSIGAALTWGLVLGVLAIGVATVLREAARRKQLGLDALTTATVALRLAGQVLLAAFVLFVYGTTGIPVLVLVAAATALAGVFVMRRTRFGRHLYAIGGNPEAARLSGIDVKRATLYVYTLLGVLTAVAGILAAARTNSVTPGNQGNLLELDAVTAVVIGGTSLAGGRGSVAGTVLGTLVFSTLSNGMNLLGIDSNWQWICTGMILLVAVLVDVLSKGKRS